MDCCDPNGLNKVFRGGYVESEKRDFLRRGLSKRQKRFWLERDLTGKSVLDIGCGVGALGLTALQRGARQAFLIDVSKDYLAAAQSLASSLGLVAKVSTAQADFVTSDAPKADLVVLDRVVCCYPDATNLLVKAAAQSQDELLFSYPRSFWFVRFGRAALNGLMRLIGREYRFYLHSEADLLAAATSQGHSLVRKEQLGLWTLAVFNLE